MLLCLDGLNKVYKTSASRVDALSDVSLSLNAGDFVAVQGPSGNGKSTLLLTAGTMLQPDSGNVSLAGEAPYAMPANLRASFQATQVGFVFQQFYLGEGQAETYQP